MIFKCLLSPSPKHLSAHFFFCRQVFIPQLAYYDIQQECLGDNLDSLGACATHEAIEIIAKAFLLDVVVDTLWDEHLAGEEEMGRQMLWARAEQAFENHDLKESAR